MKNRSMTKFFIYLLVVFFLSFITFFESALSTVAQAETNTSSGGYSEVLSDLEKSLAFSEEDFPDKPNDYSLSLITIAESEDRELYLYVYQPSHNTVDLICERVSISLGFSANGSDLNPDFYELELVSTYSVFDKYLVKGLQTENESVRYYNIVALYRAFNANLGDEEIAGGNTDYVYSAVGEQWAVSLKNGSLYYEKAYFKVLEIEPVFTGYVYYDKGFQFTNWFGFSARCDAYFIAFNITGIIENGVKHDIKVKHIYDADIEWKYRAQRDGEVSRPMQPIEKSTTYPEGEEFKKGETTLTDKQTATYEGAGLFSKSFTWDRISTSEHFISQFEDQGGELYGTTAEDIKKAQFVFSFAEYERTEGKIDGIYGSYNKWEDYTVVENVVIFRIHFLDVHDNEYDLGVVSNVTTPGKDPSGGNDNEPSIENFIDKMKELARDLAMILMACIALAVIFYFLLPFFPAIGNAILLIIGKIGKALSFILLLPFKLIGKLFNKKNK